MNGKDYLKGVETFTDVGLVAGDLLHIVAGAEEEQAGNEAAAGGGPTLEQQLLQMGFSKVCYYNIFL